MTSAFKADSWSNAWNDLRGIETDELDEAFDAASRLSSEVTKAGDWAKWAKRLGGAADLLGYVGDVCDVVEIGGDALEKGASGDYQGALDEVGYGAVKILGGKGITALAGFAIGGPAGVIVGIGVGALWDWGCEALHSEEGQKHIDAFVGGVKDFAEDVGDFFTGVGDFFGGLVPSF